MPRTADTTARGRSRSRTRRPRGAGWRPGRRSILIGVAALVLAGFLAWLLLLSPALVLKSVRVEGTAMLTPEQVTEAAAAPLGVPLARVSERAVGERVVTLPAVAKVNVRRGLPDHLVIRVTERTPIFAVGEGDPVTLVDAEGATFPGRGSPEIVQAEGPMDDPTLLAGVAAVIRALPADLRVEVERVEFTSRDSITVLLKGDREVFFGSADQPEVKGQVALALVRGTSAKHIDVSAPSRPSTR